MVFVVAVAVVNSSNLVVVVVAAVVAVIVAVAAVAFPLEHLHKALGSSVPSRGQCSLPCTWSSHRCQSFAMTWQIHCHEAVSFFTETAIYPTDPRYCFSSSRYSGCLRFIATAVIAVAVTTTTTTDIVVAVTATVVATASVIFWSFDSHCYC